MTIDGFFISGLARRVWTHRDAVDADRNIFQSELGCKVDRQFFEACFTSRIGGLPQTQREIKSVGMSTCQPGYVSTYNAKHDLAVRCACGAPYVDDA